MTVRWFSMLAIGVVVACGRDRQENAANPDSTRDTVAMATTDSLSASNRAAPPGARPGRTERPVLVVQVQEEVPGLLEQVKFHPIDAQHIAQGKYPQGTVQAGWLERRGKDLVYRFRIRDGDGSIHDVLVDSYSGTIINTIPVQ
jgi:uncharacterized membrane protein YkoI